MSPADKLLAVLRSVPADKLSAVLDEAAWRTEKLLAAIGQVLAAVDETEINDIVRHTSKLTAKWSAREREFVNSALQDSIVERRLRQGERDA